MEKQKYEFPDEVKEAPETVEDEIKVEVVDDTPPEDRGRVPLPKPIVEELENDDLEEYSEKVKKRLSQMKKVWHDERREKERVAREKEEAIRFAQQALEENKRLKSRLTEGEKIYAKEMLSAGNIEYESAKEKFKQAYDTGDADKIAEAQERLTRVTLKLRDIESFKPTALQDENLPVEREQQVNTTPVVDQKAEAWRAKNEWFGADDEMTAAALGLHQKLIRANGDAYARTDEYYRQIDATMRRRFPEYFGEDDTPPSREQEKSSPRRAANVVAPVTRSTSPRQIKLTPSQVALAKRLGLSNEAYAREMMKLESNNG